MFLEFTVSNCTWTTKVLPLYMQSLILLSNDWSIVLSLKLSQMVFPFKLFHPWFHMKTGTPNMCMHLAMLYNSPTYKLDLLFHSFPLGKNILLYTLLVLCCCCCCWRKRKERRKEEERGKKREVGEIFYCDDCYSIHWLYLLSWNLPMHWLFYWQHFKERWSLVFDCIVNYYIWFVVSAITSIVFKDAINLLALAIIRRFSNVLVVLLTKV